MSAAEVIEQIKKLPPEERRVVEEFVQCEAIILRDAMPTQSPVSPTDQATFERVSKWALEEHRELLSRLAK